MAPLILDEAVRNAQHQFTDHPVGVWIDRHEAHVIHLTEAGHTTKRVKMDQAGHKHTVHAKHHGTRLPLRVVTNEGHELGKLKHEMTAYLETVMDEVGPAQRIVVFGPADVKHELEHALLNDARWRKSKVNAMTTDRMTPNQRVAWVKRYFR